MSSLATIKTELQKLLDTANETTGKTDADLTSAVGSLVDGYGAGGKLWFELIEEVVNLGTGTEATVEDVPISAIKSNGEQYIDTGVTARSGLKVEMQAELTTSDSYQAFFGSQEAGKNRMSWYYYQNNELYYYYGSKVYPFVQRSDFAAKHIYVFDDNNVYIDGTKVSFNVSIPAETFVGTQNLYLFAQNQSEGAVDMADMILDYCKIWQNGVLVRDFVPHETEDGSIGLLDLVENQFYASQGSGQFTGVYS